MAAGKLFRGGLFGVRVAFLGRVVMEWRDALAEKEASQ
jgi:hypothetical protein